MRDKSTSSRVFNSYIIYIRKIILDVIICCLSQKFRITQRNVNIFFVFFVVVVANIIFLLFLILLLLLLLLWNWHCFCLCWHSCYNYKSENVTFDVVILIVVIVIIIVIFVVVVVVAVNALPDPRMSDKQILRDVWTDHILALRSTSPAWNDFSCFSERFYKNIFMN